MQINPIHVTETLSGKTQESQGAKERAAVEKSKTADAQSKLRAPSPELARLLDLLRQTPEIRSERVQQILERHQSGYYLTPDAADKAAQAMIDSLVKGESSI